MDKEAYLEQLKQQLTPLKADECADVIDFYTEYIEDAELTTTEEITAKLGSPKRLARKTLADYSIRATEEEPTVTTPKHNAHLIWLILLAVMASPIAIPLALAIALFFALGILMFLLCCVLLLVLTLAAGVVSVFSIIAGASVLFNSFVTGIFYIGVGLAALGATILISLLGYLILKVLLQAGATFTKFLYQKIRQHSQRKVAAK
ncbi:hypothetical protein BSQ39_03520 [Loigolactobacillus backii]|uniref:DUF1700 domain-containing protein n=1 Tax=Loigolactobacillus backii TaxID=375175 RepID=UPI000C1CB966|nr:DUF1700 domain-containing protein [Loigolactobacillus backii]PIO82707.1 hypothetical protein BSQ39_03520 [Loigolactobacillus backii]